MFSKIITCLLEKNNSIIDSKSFIPSSISYDELKILNKNGYNIYQTVNTFKNGNIRDKKHLGEYTNIFIDLDYNENDFINDGGREIFINKKYIDVYKKVLILYNEYNIFPLEINETYKGFHIIYSLDKNLNFIEEKSYLKILDFFVSYFDGDNRAKDITRIYKINGFKDNFKNRNFIIKNKLEGKNNSINDGVITINKLNKLNIFPIIDEKRNKSSDLNIEKKLNEKIKKKERNFNILNNIAFSKLVIMINDYFNKEIVKINSNGNIIVNETLYGGLKWNKYGDFINDFSHGKITGENRANGNKNFLLNIIFYNNFNEFIKFLGVKLNIQWNKGLDYIPQGMSQGIGILKGEYNLYSEEHNALNRLILKGVDLSEYIKYILGLLIMINDKKYEIGINENGEESYLFQLNDYLNEIGINSIKNGNVRNKIKNDLLRISYIKREVKEKVATSSGKMIDITSYMPLFNIGFGVGVRKKDIISLKIEKFNKIYYFNRNILNIKTRNNKVLLFAYKISVSCHKGKIFSLSEEKIREELGIGVNRKDKYKAKVKEHLNLLKGQSIIKKYEFNKKDGLYIYT